ncbi:uncharacterized protein K460DRAFT_371939 [Cucurbitaria berberidis CBS 394.84]|uniref:Uncharacterized protein n=1 Tax=Cucurbitaria berberidis CBS 394.84 TaxID=1168544 RepID=A0A9P4G6S9_9PLEO|nr:uncharacterized protein K460DRAFT_371939 [Cucurbitaria berberidis CBS 394.84]KAF1839981.1 hypothetical protein K460DRAFT_371939 [Cucurbitaria berberidis CBS 394.84]
MTEPSPVPAPQTAETEPVLVNGLESQGVDVVMADSSAQHQLSPNPTLTHAPQPSLQPSVSTQPPTPQPAPTPAPPAAASSRNSPLPTQQAPTQPIPHGSPTRVYLNQHVTPHLLEAMKHLATTEPDKPLKWLSEFLAMKSAEIEGP